MSKPRTIIPFENRARHDHSKICQCKPPRYEIDVGTRTVTCMRCGLSVDPFDALLTLAESMDVTEQKLELFKKTQLEKAVAYAEETDKELKRMCKDRAFRSMENNYRHEMLPICPSCGEAFDPAHINHWINSKMLNPDT